ncbi:iron-sulfur cluster biosynthesis family protein [Paenibacillus sp. CMAA1739]|uniref:iron-sulfur cluster biosynthesis family protein n=1 Tax=Paenibacillus ottowii TaxID=2315729 RepID=UPI00273195BA|nr:MULTISPECIES: iron-sulfur cluster biosynthesis family protein [Paenibacillus]MDP1510010.1 iron-sulfur cluster biosynthesis family protein [Paenibacillus ottowii]MEC4567977.1 iron-sulfur cluster biosynthesis family protein [Paenibacillus sp. CMAA1739]
MNIHLELDSLSVERLASVLSGRPGMFKLFYDTEDCGCNGVLVILVVDAPNATDIAIQSNSYSFWIDRQQEQQFDSRMRLEADPSYPSFKLSSDAGMFSSNIRIQDRRINSSEK